MAVWLKQGSSAQVKADQDRQVRETVESILAEVAARGSPLVK